MSVLLLLYNCIYIFYWFYQYIYKCFNTFLHSCMYLCIYISIYICTFVFQCILVYFECACVPSLLYLSVGICVLKKIKIFICFCAYVCMWLIIFFLFYNCVPPFVLVCNCVCVIILRINICIFLWLCMFWQYLNVFVSFCLCMFKWCCVSV